MSSSSSPSVSGSAQGYSDRLQNYENKGQLNLQPDPEPALCILYKARYIAALIKAAQHVVFHTGAGISTNAGIPDFRGPNGVWTCQQVAEEAQGPSPTKRRRVLMPASSPAAKPTLSFEEALPTLTHCVMKVLLDKQYAHYVISQNVDNLHRRSGVRRHLLSELHGNLFVDWCRDGCGRELQRDSQALSVGHKPTGRSCPHCNHEGSTVDKALDWEDALPEPDYGRAQTHAHQADLHIVAGTSCQMTPARSMPFSNRARRAPARVLVNLSQTPFDSRFGCVVRADTDSVFAALALFLDVEQRVEPMTRCVTFGFSARETEVFDVDSGSEVCTIGCSARIKWDGAWTAIPDLFGVKGVQYATRLESSIESTELKWSEICCPSRQVSVSVPCSSSAYTLLARVVIVQGAEHNREDAVHVVPLNKAYNDCAHRIVTRIERHDERLKELVDRLHSDAFDESSPFLDIQLLTIGNVFVSSTKRGWSMCVLCRKLMWSSAGKREEHMCQCVRHTIASRSSLLSTASLLPTTGTASSEDA